MREPTKSDERRAAIVAERDRYKVERDALMEMIRIIPCTCHAGYNR